MNPIVSGASVIAAGLAIGLAAIGPGGAMPRIRVKRCANCLC
jgi:F0F1-type ATP synthase membrane subunit c/vacuolar-type H+-ATPase subunit K